jgi:hypothetical protein
MGRRINLVGQRFGSFLVIGEADRPNPMNTRINKFWLCRCDCGTEKAICGADLTSGNTKTCGDRNKHYENLAGTRYGRLVAIEKVDKPEKLKGNASYWRCKCDCGTEIIACSANLKRGHTSSCGCKQKEIASLGHLVDGNAPRYPTYWYFIQNNEIVKCRSSYEVIFANHLTRNNIEFIYEPETFILDLEKGKRIYTPDFLIISENKYIELKGAFLNDQQERIEFFKKDHDISVLYWEDIVDYCSLPYAKRYTYNKHAEKLGLKIQDYLASGLYMS